MRGIIISPRTSNIHISKRYPDIFEITSAKNEVIWLQRDLPFPEHTYYFSKIDTTDKFSKKFEYCICVMITGLEKEIDIPISFLGHLTPNISTYGIVKFMSTFRTLLFEFKSKAQTETIFATICGGCFMNKKEKSQYSEIVGTVQHVLDEARIGIKSKVLKPKNEYRVHDNIYLKTDKQVFYNRRTYR